MLNSPNQLPTVRAPRLRVLNNGRELTGALSFEITQTSSFQADEFSVQFSASSDPNHGAPFFGDVAPPLVLDIQASLDGGSSFSSLILGLVDYVDSHTDIGLIRVDGRDLVAATLIDARANPKVFLNQSAAGIVRRIAAGHGFSADAVGTPDAVGVFDGLDKSLVQLLTGSRGITDWDVLSGLAQHAGYDLWTSDTTIHFTPRSSTDPFLVTWDQEHRTSNVIDLTLEKKMPFDAFTVVVRSWQSRESRVVEATAGTGSRRYVYTRPNLSLAAAQAFADQVYADLARHQFRLSFQWPGDLTLTARSLITIQGTNSTFDRAFRVLSLRRQLSFSSGFTTSVEALAEPAA